MKPLSDPYPIEPLTKPPNCTITVPGSKSITNRALILAALAKGRCTLRGALWADDTQVMVDSLQKLGFGVAVEPDFNEECNRMITILGRDGEIPAKKAELYVGNAGTAARFLTALVCLGHGEYTIRGDKRMHERPMKELFEALRAHGAKIEAVDDHLPAVIHAEGLRGGEVLVDAKRSSQFASALVLISERCGLVVTMASAEDGQNDEMHYYQMTQSMVKQWKVGDYDIEPDFSSASYFRAVDFLTRGHVLIQGAHSSSLQVDSEFDSYLRSPVSQIEMIKANREGRPPVASISRTWHLADSIMTFAICGLFGKYQLNIVDAARLRLQETDRIKAMVTELQRIGAKAEEHEDGFTVWPAAERQLHGADIETYNDHRMAMCFSVLGLKVPGIRIKNPQCVSKTFPNFFDKLEQLRQ